MLCYKDKRFFGKRRELAIYGGGSEQTIPAKIEINTLEQMLEIENAITTVLENLDLVIEPFHEAAIFTMDKEIGDFFPPVLE